MWEDNFGHVGILLCYCSLCNILLLITGMLYMSLVSIVLSSNLGSRNCSFILYWSLHNTFTHTALESIFWCTAGKYKDCYFHWECVIIGACACPCNSSHWSDAMHLSKYWSTMEFFIPDSYNSFLMAVFPILKRGSNFLNHPLVGI